MPHGYKTSLDFCPGEKPSRPWDSGSGPRKSRIIRKEEQDEAGPAWFPWRIGAAAEAVFPGEPAVVTVVACLPPLRVCWPLSLPYVLPVPATAGGGSQPLDTCLDSTFSMCLWDAWDPSLVGSAVIVSLGPCPRRAYDSEVSWAAVTGSGGPTSHC